MLYPAAWSLALGLCLVPIAEMLLEESSNGQILSVNICYCVPFQGPSASVTENWTKVVSGLCHDTWIGMLVFSDFFWHVFFLWSVLLVLALFCCVTATLLWWIMGKQGACLGIPGVFQVFVSLYLPESWIRTSATFSMFSNAKCLNPFNPFLNLSSMRKHQEILKRRAVTYFFLQLTCV